MKVLVVGSGGREHALCWKLAQSARVEKLWCAPGNAGIAAVAECVAIAVDEYERIADFAEANEVELVVVGPEAPLCGGLADRLRERGIAVFGPGAAAARLEGSKDFAKRFMKRYNIPTAASETFTDAEAARCYVREQFAAGKKAVVVKADGLAAGKGVLVAEDQAAAESFVSECFGGVFGESGATVVIEECLYGEEASILALCDGRTIVPLVSSQDHKRAYDFDCGPNTGGMGAYSPAPVVTPEVAAQIDREILQPFLAGIRAEHLDFRGVIFVGIMVTEEGAKVLEFNVRFGDPEVQPVLRRFEGDLCEVMALTAAGKLDQAKLAWSDEPAVSVVIASGGYPGHYVKGFPISGLDEAARTGAVVFHAGTAFKDGAVVSAGGRVLGVSARGATIREAIDRAYAAVKLIRFQDCFCRQDIGAKALARMEK